MNTILQKRIEEAAKKICCTDCPFNSIRNCKECVEKRNAIKTATFALQNQWISVEEALPDVKGHEFSERFFVRTKDNEFKVMRVFKNIAWCDIYECQSFVPFESNIVTHWMPIPSLKGGEE